MTSERDERYIDELRRAFRSHGILDVQIVEELREHLIDAIEEGRLRGLHPGDAEREAIAKCGPPDLVAAHVAARVSHRAAAAHGTRVWGPALPDGAFARCS